MARKYSNISTVMNLTVAATTSDTTITVNNATGLPVTFPYIVAIGYEAVDLELVLVTSTAANVLTVTRGQEDTPARPHSIGATVVHVATAMDYKNAADHIEATQNVHGIGATASVVGTDTAQTLTNKTMSGSNNTFSNIPASAITGTFNNITVGQSNAATPAVTINPNVAPAANIIQFPYTSRLDQNGVWFLRGNTGQTFVQRWEDSGGVVRASMAAADGAFTCGPITAGAIGGTSASISGNITGGTVTSTGTLTASGAVNVAGLATFNNDVQLVGAGSDLTVGGAFTVTGTANLNGTTTNINGTTTNLNATTTDIDNPKSSNAFFLRSAANFNLTADQGSAGGSGSFTDLTGCTTSVVIPAGYTGRVVVRGDAVVRQTLGNTTFNLMCNVAGVDEAKFPSTLTGVAAATTTTFGRTWVLSLAAGTYTVKLRYQNVNGTGTATFESDGTTMAVEVFY